MSTRSALHPIQQAPALKSPASDAPARHVQLKGALRQATFDEGAAMLTPADAVQMKGAAKKPKGGTNDLMSLHEADAEAALAEEGGGDLMALHEADARDALAEKGTQPGKPAAKSGAKGKKGGATNDLMGLHKADAAAALADKKVKQR